MNRVLAEFDGYMDIANCPRLNSSRFGPIYGYAVCKRWRLINAAYCIRSETELDQRCGEARPFPTSYIYGTLSREEIGMVKVHLRILIAVSLFCLLAFIPPAPAPSRQGQSTVDARRKQLQALFDEQWEYELRTHPEMAT